MTPHLRDDELLDASPDALDHLRRCETCEARRAAHAALRAALHGLPREDDVPERARALLDEARRRAARRRLAFGALALTAALVVALTVGRARGRPMPNDLADELALDHLHYEHRSEAATVKGDAAVTSAYFESELGFSPHYGALEGVTLEGAKPCRIAGQWTALLWLDRAGHWLSLFTMPHHPPPRRGCVATEGVRVCAAPDPDGGARVLVGDLSEAEMLRLVDDSLR